MTNKHLGNTGEEYAALYLQQQGYHILHRNWRIGHCEIDLITQVEDMIVFVEVKTRKSTRYGFPEESVSEKKMERLLKAAREYLLSHPSRKIRFDVISILLNHGEVRDFLHIRDAF